MPEWLLPAVSGVIGSALAAGGLVAGHKITAKSQERAAGLQHEVSQVTAQDKLIDQLQEELSSHRTSQESRMTAQDARLNGLEERNGVLVDRNDRYRDLLHQHRAHIWDGKPPPPPEWPKDLPR